MQRVKDEHKQITSSEVYVMEPGLARQLGVQALAKWSEIRKRVNEIHVLTREAETLDRAVRALNREALARGGVDDANL